MQVTIKATKIELTDEMKQYIYKKMDMLDKYLGQIKVVNCSVEVELAVGAQNSGKIYRAEVNLQVPGKLLRVDKMEEDLFKAIDKVKDHLEVIIKRYKEKKIAKVRRV